MVQKVHTQWIMKLVHIVDALTVAGVLLWAESISSHVEQRNLSIAKELVGEKVSTNIVLAKA